MFKVIAILLVAELFVAFFVLAPTCILRHDQKRAFAAWHANPTPETKAEFDRQERITRYQRVAFSAVVFSVMASLTFLGAHVFRHRHPLHEHTA